MVSAKTSSPNRLKSCWRSSAKIAQAFHIAKKLNQTLDLPGKIRLTWKGREGGPDLSLKNIKIHQAIGIKLLEVDQDRSRKRAYAIFNYQLVFSRYQKPKTLNFLIDDVLSFLIKQRPQEIERVKLAMHDSLMHSEKIPITTEYQLIFEKLEPDSTSPDHAYDRKIERHSYFSGKPHKPQRHPLERIKAFLWTRKNYDLLVQAGVIKPSLQPPSF
ncbi:MAG: hypothetical protein V3T21_01325 [Candidatus Margulisiibacteriota bacterium]